MKQIIRKKLYDTKTAQLIASWDNQYGLNDFNANFEKLFLSPEGHYFIFKSLNPITSYSIKLYNKTSFNSELKLISEEKAIRWLYDKGFFSIIRKFFS